MKRLVDLVLSFAALLVLSPILALAAAAVRLTMGSPVLFRQERIGRHGRAFELLKLRTMHGSGGDDAERLTAVGRFLRRTSLDELPQLVNVLRGDMSLVGPRPLLPEYLPLYTPEQMRRHDVLPGITGWTQVNGRNSLGWEDKFRLDVWYVDHQSTLLDLRILALTARRVLEGSGVAAEGHASMPKFTGSPQRNSNDS